MERVERRLQGLEEAVASIASKLDSIAGEPTRSSSKRNNWTRLYSSQKRAHFWYSRRTNKAVWEVRVQTESAKSGLKYEKFTTPNEEGSLDSFFLDPGSCRCQYEPPTPSKEKMSLGFDPGSFDASTFMPRHQSSRLLSRQHSLSVKHAGPKVSNVEQQELQRLELVNKLEAERARCMANPHGHRRMAWDFAVIFPCLAYLTIMMPYRLCFHHEAQGGMLWLETSMDLIFILDILLNFRTGYFDETLDAVVYSPSKVANKYLRTWFCLDALSGIPFDLLNESLFSQLSFIKVLKSSRTIKAFKVLRFLKLTRMIKSTKLVMGINRETLDRFEDMMNNMTMRSVFQMARLLFFTGLACHFLCCLWVAIGRDAYVKGARNWLENDVGVYEGGLTASDTEGTARTMSVYISAYYFCFTTITSVGYGDVHPYNDDERLFAIGLEALGGFLYAIIIASLTSIVTSTDSNKRAISERLDMVSSYVKSRGFPETLGRKVRRYFRHFYETKTAVDEQSILADLPSSLRHEVSNFLVSGLMSQVPLFRNLSPFVWARILPLLRPCRFMADDVVCDQGDACVETFIVIEGECSAVTVVDPEHHHSLRASHHQHRRHQERDLPGGLNPPSHLSPRGTLRRGLSHAILDGKKAARVAPDHLKSSRQSMSPNLNRALSKSLERIAHRNDSSDDDSDDLTPENCGQLQQSSVVHLGSIDSGGVKSFDLSNPNVHFRVLEPGAMANMLCMIGVWDTCLETVVAVTEKVELYAINAVEFKDIFANSQGTEAPLREMRETAVFTSFHMFKERGAADNGDSSGQGGGYGTPLYMYSAEEVAFRTEKYEDYQQVKKAEFAKALRKHEAEMQVRTSMQKNVAMGKIATMVRRTKERRQRRTAFDDAPPSLLPNHARRGPETGKLPALGEPRTRRPPIPEESDMSVSDFSDI